MSALTQPNKNLPASYQEMSAELRVVYDELRVGLKFNIVARGNTLPRLPTEKERTALQARAVSLNGALRAISYTAHGPQMGLAGAAIAEMLHGFEAWKTKNLDKETEKNKQDSVGWYVHELRDMPLFAIEAACKLLS